MNAAFAYRPHLDGLRSIAVLLVLAVHASYGNFRGGFLGVDLFFVLSGFLITGLLVDEQDRFGRIDLPAFYMRRVFRILPPLLACLVLAGLLWDGTASNFVGVAAATLFFIANFFQPEFMGSMAHAWSLSIEEQFYLLWPWLVLATLARRSRLLWGIAIAVVVLSPVLRFFLAEAGHAKMNYTFSLARADAIMWGCLLALSRDKWAGLAAAWPRKPVHIAAGLALLGILLWGSFGVRSFMENWAPGLGLFALLGAVLIGLLDMADESAWAKRILSWAPMVYLGRRSYGLYLYHYPIFFYLEHFRTPGDRLNLIIILALKIALSLAATEISYRFIERPVLERKKRWGTKRRSTLS